MGAKTVTAPPRYPPDTSLHAAEPQKLAAVVYTYVDGMVDKRGPYRSDHLDLLKSMTEEGTCLLGDQLLLGCTTAVGGLFVGDSGVRMGGQRAATTAGSDCVRVFSLQKDLLGTTRPRVAGCTAARTVSA